MTRVASRSLGTTLANVLVFLGALSVGAALLYPAWSGRTFRERVRSAIADVDSLRRAARASSEIRGAWPTAAAPGEAPPELPGLAGADGIFSRLGYTLGWTTWEVVDSVEAPPEEAPPPVPGDAPPDSVGPLLLPITWTVGAVSVYTGEQALLAELIDHFGGDASFVLDTMWVLVVAEGSRRAPGGG